MRLVVAIISFLLAAAMITVGLVQRTVLAPADSTDLAVSTTGNAQVTILDGATLRTHEGRQTIRIGGPAQVVAAYGRSTDVRAWIGDAAYNEITIDEETGEFVATRHPGSNDPLPSLYDSDLWLESYRDTQQLRLSVTLPEDVSLILASTGGMPAPSHVAVSWPIDSGTPWSGPLILGGSAVFVFGLIVFLMGIYRIRSHHGPKRKMPKVPKRKSITSVRPGTPPVSGALARTNGKSGMRARSGTVTLLVVGALAVAMLPQSVPAAAADSPRSSSTSTPTPSPTPAEPVAPVPAVTTVQLDRIIEKTLATIAEADTAMDLDLLDTRMHGPALALKTADYALRAKDAAATGESPEIPSGGVVALSLPQQVPADSPSWPRTLFVVIAPPEALAAPGQGSPPSPTPTPDADGEAVEETEAPVVESPVAMLLTQAAPRDNYEVEYLMTLQSDVPEVAAPTVGAPVLRPDTPLLSVAPEEIIGGYADVLANGDASEWADRFELVEDAFAAAWGLDAQAAYQASQAGLDSPNTVSYSTAATESPLVTLAATDGGAIVTGTVRQNVTVTPSEEGAKVIAQGKVLTLSGVERSESGYALSYIGQLLFFVPPLGSDAPIRVLAYAQGLESATEAS